MNNVVHSYWSTFNWIGAQSFSMINRLYIIHTLWIIEFPHISHLLWINQLNCNTFIAFPRICNSININWINHRLTETQKTHSQLYCIVAQHPIDGRPNDTLIAKIQASDHTFLNGNAFWKTVWVHFNSDQKKLTKCIPSFWPESVILRYAKGIWLRCFKSIVCNHVFTKEMKINQIIFFAAFRPNALFGICNRTLKFPVENRQLKSVWSVIASVQTRRSRLKCRQ